MRINSTPYLYQNKFPQNKRPVVASQIRTTMTSPRKAHGYRPINFRGTTPTTEDKLKANGYEEIKINQDGKISNQGKFLIINKPEHLVALSTTPEALNRSFVLTKDIDMQGIDFKPLGKANIPFSGIFDGNGHSVKNLTINKPTSNDVGFFSSCENAKILNLSLENINITAQSEVGGLVGYSDNSIIKDCRVAGTITGDSVVGGIIGVSKFNKVNGVVSSGEIKNKFKKKTIDLFEEKTTQSLSSHFGGIIATDEGSTVDGAHSSVKINATKNVGGIIGNTYAHTVTQLSNSVFNGELSGESNVGALVGYSGNTSLSKCYAINEELIGGGTNFRQTECFNSISEIKSNMWNSWNKDIWELSPHTLPRLKSVNEKENPAITFFQDITNAYEVGLFPNSSSKYTPPTHIEVPLLIKPPTHYERNENLLARIKNSNDSGFLFQLFSDYTNAPYKRVEDEILLELVKNKKLPINKTYGFHFGYSAYCTPLYIATRIEKPYVLQEMFKRDDLDFSVKSGPGKECDIIDIMMEKSGDDESLYVLFSSKNPLVKKSLSEKLKKASTIRQDAILLNVLRDTYPDIPEISKDDNTLRIPKKYFSQLDSLESFDYDSNNKAMLCLEDVQKNMDVSPNYRDVNGNNIINVATTLNNESYALGLYKRAVVRGTDVNNKNKSGESPIATLLRTEKNQHILSEIIKKIDNPNETNLQGENAIHVFSKNQNENKAILLLEEAINTGLSINSQDNSGNTALMNAIDKKHYNMVQFLLINGADVNLCDENGQSALHRACINYNDPSDIKFIHTLVKQNALMELLDTNGNKPEDYLDDAAKQLLNMNNEQIQNIRDSLSQDPIAYSAFPSEPVEYNQYIDFQRNSNIFDTDSKTLIQTKTSKIKLDEPVNFEELESNLNNEQKRDETLFKLNFALRKGKVDFSQKYGEGNNLLHLLSKTQSPFTKECIQVICQTKQLDVNDTNDLGETPLMTAVDSYNLADNNKQKFNCIDNVKILLENGAKVNLQDTNGQNVLHKVCQTDSIILLSKLLELDANINQKDKLGKNPIEYLTCELTDKMRVYYENYALKKNLRLGFK